MGGKALVREELMSAVISSSGSPAGPRIRAPVALNGHPISPPTRSSTEFSLDGYASRIEGVARLVLAAR